MFSKTGFLIVSLVFTILFGISFSQLVVAIQQQDQFTVAWTSAACLFDFAVVIKCVFQQKIE